MKTILKIISLIMILVLFIGCKKTEPIVTEPTVIPTLEETQEEIGVIQQITENVSEEGTPSQEEEPEKPDEDIENATETAIIKIEDLKFLPKELNVSAGTTVIWQHRDEYGGKDWIKHVLTVYPPKGPGFTSKPMFLGDDFNVTLTEKGRYRYMSIPYKNRMQGFIEVE